MSVHYLRRQPDEPAPAERFDYMDNPAVQIGVGAIAACWFVGFFAWACVAYGVDAVIRLGLRGTR